MRNFATNIIALHQKILNIFFEDSEGLLSNTHEYLYTYVPMCGETAVAQRQSGKKINETPKQIQGRVPSQGNLFMKKNFHYVQTHKTYVPELQLTYLHTYQIKSQKCSTY
jgi:hypothetical protein